VRAIEHRFTGVRVARQAGFSLVEMLVATSLTLLAMGGVMAVLDPARGAFRAQPEAADLQQRLRAAVGALERDLSMAGAGLASGPVAGPLGTYFSPVLPYGVGSVARGSPESPEPSTVTVMYVAPDAPHTHTTQALAADGAAVALASDPGCPLNDDACGFDDNMRVLLMDEWGKYDVFTVAGTDRNTVALQHRDHVLNTMYPAGTTVAGLVSRTYYLDRAGLTLRVYDGYKSDLPLVDNVVDLHIEYFGEPAPPALLQAVTARAGPWTTYGPRPPPIGVDAAGDRWGPGENCAFRVSGGGHVARLADLRGSGSAGALVPLPFSLFTDGPWCPDRTNEAGAPLPGRFDADLLRVRLVRVTIRLQAGSDLVRGADGARFDLFARPGRARSGHTLVPDQVVRFDVVPRNLNARR
jgi:hypothetical protein